MPLNRFFKILRRSILIFLAILLLAFIAIQTNFVQNWLIKIATERLSASLGTEVRVKKVSFALFNRLNMEDILVRDLNKDTLLYAKQLNVRITDWFFLQRQIELKYIGMEDALVKMNRKDSVWNYQFIADFFASPNPSKKKKGLALNLKKIDLKNIHFLKEDRWAGEHMDITTTSLLLDAEKIDFDNNLFVISSLTLDNPSVSIKGLPSLRPVSVSQMNAKGADTGLYLNPGYINARVENIMIKNGSLFLDSDDSKPIPHFDGSHIRLSNLTGRIDKFDFLKDTLRATVDLKVRDRSGIELKKLKANFRFTPQIMEFSNLDLHTNKSHLSNYFAMKFRDFNPDFGQFNSKVIMDARFRDARISSDDIAFFAPELSNWKKVVSLNGNFLGSVEDFTVNNLTARIGATTNINGTLHMKGLPDIDRTKISLTRGGLQTNYFDLAVFIPGLKDIKSPNLTALGTIIYRGNFNGTIHDFVTEGVFSTQLGGVKTNVSLQLPKNGEPTYKGAIETVRFNMGKFLNDTALGLVDFKGNITGSSFALETLKTTLEGKISSLVYNNYNYTNITTNGTFQKKYFSGEVKINDPNLDFTSNVEIDLSNALPKFNMVGDLTYSNLKALKILKDSVELTGLLDVNFTGTTIDNFLGTAKILNTTVKKDDITLSFDSLNLTSSYIDSVKSLHLISNEFQANITGNFSILDLPAGFQGFIHNYFPTYIKSLSSIPKNQHFTFTLTTNYFEPYLKLLDNKIAGFNDATISGSIDTRSNQLGIKVAIPFGKYDHTSFTGMDLLGTGNIDTLSLTGIISSIQATDSLRFPNTKISIQSHNDHSIVSIKTSADNTINDAGLFADVYTLPDGVRIGFRPSSFLLNEKKWGIEKSGELIVRKQMVQAKNVKFSQGFQEISVETGEEEGGNTQNLIVKLKDVVMGDLTSLLFKDPRLEGITSGKIVLSDFYGPFHIRADLKAEQFRLDDDSIGRVDIQADFDSKSGEIPFTVQSPNEGYRFTARGSYNIKDTTGNSFHTDIQLQNTKIDILHKFLSDLFSDISGQAIGNLSINGNLNAPDLLGKIKLRNAGMKVNYSQVYYTIDSADIAFNEDGIDFGSFAIHDRYKNTGTVRGKLFEKGFKNLRFDFDLSTDKLLLIDTKFTDNQQFYGKAIGKANLVFSGPEYNARMYIEAESNDSSHIFIPNSISRESGDASFIVFKQYGTEMARENSNSKFNLTVDMKLTLNNQVMIDVILDELTGDVIKAVGNGILRIKAGTTEPINIRGRYNIDRGDYVFNFQGLIRKPFILLPDVGSYLEWTGDPFNADIHIDAQYIAERISLSELASTLNLSSGAVKGYRGDVYVIAQLREKLSKPDIKFRLDFPQGSPVKSDNVFTQYLNRLEKDQTEILNQVAFLILFNSFAPPGGGGGNSSGVSPYSIASIGVNTLSQVLTKSVNKVVSNLLYKLTGDQSLRFDLGASIYSGANLINPGGDINASSASLDRTTVDLKFSKAFANDKIIVTLGSDIDFNFKNTTAQNGNTQWLPNVNIEFVLSKDRKLRLIIFNKSSLDISGASFGRRNKQGVSISYRKDFETLFGNKEDQISFKPPVDSARSGNQ